MDDTKKYVTLRYNVLQHHLYINVKSLAIIMNNQTLITR